MATKSIIKDIEIKDSSSTENLIKALVENEQVINKQVKLSRKCTELTCDDIKEFFKN